MHGKGFNIGMHRKRFYNMNAFERVLLDKCIGKAFNIELFYYRKALEKFLLNECIRKCFNIGIHWIWLYYVLERILL